MEAEVEDVLQKLKGNVRESEKLKEENKRLKKYVRDLQAALCKARILNPREHQIINAAGMMISNQLKNLLIVWMG